MPVRTYTIWIDAPIEAVWAFHASVEALPLLTPPDRTVRILSEDVAVRNGALHQLAIRMKGLPVRWDARISDVEPPTRFVDTAERSPFAVWRHEHRFTPENGGTRLTDTVEYRLPFGPIGAVVDRLFVGRDLDAMFAFRHEATRAALASTRPGSPAPDGAAG